MAFVIASLFFGVLYLGHRTNQLANGDDQGKKSVPATDTIPPTGLAIPSPANGRGSPLISRRNSIALFTQMRNQGGPSKPPRTFAPVAWKSFAALTDAETQLATMKAKPLPGKRTSKGPRTYVY